MTLRTMVSSPLPLLILGGSDRKPATLPPTGEGEHPLFGCKGVDVRIGDTCLIELLVERLRASGFFDPLFIAGPASVYDDVVRDVTVIDTDGGFGANIQAGVERVMLRHPRSSIAITTCDILPAVDELRHLMANYCANVPSDLWFPLIRAPQDPRELGPSAWKPQYYIVPEPGAPAVRVLPGHLTVFDPHAMRHQLLYRLFDLGYRTRNRPIPFRRTYMLQQIIGHLLIRDFLDLVRFRLPTLSWDVVANGVRAARQLKDGVITQARLEDAMRRLFVTRAHRRRFPRRRIQVPLMEALTLARDIDTEEEAAALGATAL